MTVKKEHIFSFIYVAVISLLLIFFLWTYFFGFYWSNGVTSSIVRILARLNLLDFHSHIGGHTAHLHDFVWLLSLLFGLVYAVAVSYLFTSKMKIEKGKFFVRILVFLISFTLHLIITFNFLLELERFAYPFFVPPL